MKYSLPNLLFGERPDSPLLKFFNKLDPTIYRDELLDQFLIDLYVKEDTKKILDEYLDLTRFDFLQEYGKSLEYFKDFKGKTFNELPDYIKNILLSTEFTFTAFNIFS